LGAFQFAQELAEIDCLVDLDCSGECGGSANLDECGVCEGDGSTCGIVGDVNQDTIVNILDVVSLINTVLAWEYNSAGDINNDGANDIVDIVQLINIILSVN